MFLHPCSSENQEPNPLPLLPSSSVSEKEQCCRAWCPPSCLPFYQGAWPGSPDQGSKAFRLLNYFLQRNSSSPRRTGNQIQSKALGTLQGPKI